MAEVQEQDKSQRKRKRRRIRVLIRWTAGTLLLLLAFCELFLYTSGWPAFLRRIVERKLVPAQYGTCRIESIRGALFTDFRLGNLQLQLKTEAEDSFALHLPELRISPRWEQLLTGKPAFNTLDTSNGVITFSNAADSVTMQPKVVIRDISISLQHSKQNLLTGSASCSIHGITLNSSIRLENFIPGESDFSDIISSLKLERVNSQENTAPQEKGTPAEAVAAPVGAAVGQAPLSLIYELHRHLRQVSMNDSNTYFSSHFSGDMAHPETIRCNGEFDISGGMFSSVIIPKSYGKFQYRSGRFSLNDLHIIISSTESVTGSADLDLESFALNAHLTGELLPYTGLRLAGFSTSIFPEWLNFPTPLRFSAHLPPTVLGTDFAAPEISFHLDSVNVAGLPLYSIEGTLIRTPGKIRLTGLKALLDAQGRNHFRGAAIYDLESGKLSAAANGSADLLHTMQKLNMAPTLNSVFARFRNTSFQLQLHPSPLKVEQLHLEGRLVEPAFRISNLLFNNFESTFTMKSGRIDIREAAASLASQHYSRFTGSASAALADLLSGQARVPFKIALEMPDLARRPLNPYGASASGTLNIDRASGTFSVNGISGHIFPEIIAPLAQFRGNPDMAYLAQFVSCLSSVPLTFSGEIPQVSIHTPEDLAVKLKCVCPKMTLLNVPLQHGTCDTTITAKGLAFHNIVAETIYGDSGALNIDIDFLPFSLAISDLYFKGDPLNITPFIGIAVSQNFYRKIWQHSQWDKETPPEIHIPTLLFTGSTTSKSQDWQLLLDGTFSASNSRFRGVLIPELSCRLFLELPQSGLKVEDIRAGYSGDTPLTANASFQFNNNVECDFTINSPPEQLNVVRLAKAAVPSVAETLSQLRLHPETSITCHGNFATGISPSLRISGTIASKQLVFRKIVLDDLNGNWHIDNRHINWHVPQATFCGGSLVTSGEYDFPTRKAEIFVRSHNIPLAGLAESISQYRDCVNDSAEETGADLPKLNGLLDGSAHLMLFHDWADQSLMLEGNGNLRIHEADLWRVPMLATLGKLISVGTFNFFSKDKIASLGKISTLESDITFSGSRVRFENMQTDGTFIALAGGGEYNIADNSLRLTVGGHLMKKISLISWLLRPVTWAFEAELNGTPQKYDWELNSSLGKFL